jgi:osmoprotectant transport system permease protein
VNPDSFIWWAWVRDHRHDILLATYEHLRLTLLAVVIGLVISLALAVVARRWRIARPVITGAAGVLYTIPSLALFATLVTITGFTTLTAEIGLVGYTLLILVRNLLEGLDGVPTAVREAADAMGFGPVRRVLAVDLRLALPAIAAGVRIATVTTVGLVTVTGLIGMGGYGSFIDAGLDRVFSTEVVVGAVLSVAMAVVLDGVLVLATRLLTPWQHASGARRRDRGAVLEDAVA